jgi:hypothetical protein
MKKSIDKILEYYKERIEFILDDKIGNFIFPDKNIGKASLILPDKKYGSNYPPPGTILQENKLGLLLKASYSQNFSLIFNETDLKIKVSIFTNKDANYVLEAWGLLFSSSLPILGQPKLESGSIDPIVKHFLIFHLLTSIG